MKKQIMTLISVLSVTAMLTACGPSEKEKQAAEQKQHDLAVAQQAYDKGVNDAQQSMQQQTVQSAPAQVAQAPAQAAAPVIVQQPPVVMQQQPTVVHDNSGSNLLTGMVLGHMLSNSGSFGGNGGAGHTTVVNNHYNNTTSTNTTVSRPNVVTRPTVAPRTYTAPSRSFSSSSVSSSRSFSFRQR